MRDMGRPRKWISERRINGEWIRWRRETLRLSQGELARRVGCSRPNINRIEKGLRAPRPVLSERINEVLS